MVENYDHPSKSYSDILHLLSPPTPDQAAVGNWQVPDGARLGVPVVQVSTITLRTPLPLGLPRKSVLEPGQPPDESLAQPELQNILAFPNVHLLVKAHPSTAFALPQKSTE